MEDLAALRPKQGYSVLFHMHQSYRAKFNLNQECRGSIYSAIKTGVMLEQMEEDLTTIIDWMLTRERINDFTSSRNNMRTLEKKFSQVMQKRNESVDKRC